MSEHVQAKTSFFNNLAVCNPPCVEPQGSCVAPNTCSCTEPFTGATCNENTTGKEKLITVKIMKNWDTHVSLLLFKDVTACTQIRRCVMKFCQNDKISTCTCIFGDAAIL